jgi:hypothetical protein
VIALAVIAVLLLVGGLLALILPSTYEGEVLLELDEQHVVRVIDGLGLLLLVLGCLFALGAGISWQRRMDAS